MESEENESRFPRFHTALGNREERDSAPEALLRLAITARTATATYKVNDLQPISRSHFHLGPGRPRSNLSIVLHSDTVGLQLKCQDE